MTQGESGASFYEERKSSGEALGTKAWYNLQRTGGGQENVAVYVCVCVHRGSYFGVCEWHCTIGVIFSKHNYIKETAGCQEIMNEG